MSDEVILSNEVSREGVQTLHIARMGLAPEVGRWAELLPPGRALDTLQFLRWVDEMEVHHLVLTWCVRDICPLGWADESRKVVGVMWWILDGQRMSEAIREAAERFFLGLGIDAGVAVCRKIPGDAPGKEINTKTQRHNDAKEESFEGGGRVKPIMVPVLGKDIVVELMEADWAPKRSVVLLKNIEEAMWLTSNRT